MTRSGENGLNIRTNASPNWGQDQVSGGVSVLCWLAATVAMFYGSLPKFGNKVNIGNKVQFGNKFIFATYLCYILYFAYSLSYYRALCHTTTSDLFPFYSLKWCRIIHQEV